MLKVQSCIAKNAIVQIGFENDVSDVNQLAIKLLWRSPGMYLHDRVFLFKHRLHPAIPVVFSVFCKVMHARVDQSVWKMNITLFDILTILVDSASKADSSDVWKV